MKKRLLIMFTTILMLCSCAGKPMVKQQSWNEMLDGSNFQHIGLNPVELDNNINSELEMAKDLKEKIK